jgi:hypothetical protein
MMVFGLFSHPVAPSAAAHTGAKAFCASLGPRDYAALGSLPPIDRIHPGPKEHPGLGNTRVKFFNLPPRPRSQ